MPAMQLTTTRPQAIRSGDVIHDETLGQTTLTVEEVTVGTKWVHVKGTNGKTFRVLRGQEDVTIERLLPTAEEKAEQEQEYLVRQAAEVVKHLISLASSDPLEALAEKVGGNPDTLLYHLSWNGDDLLLLGAASRVFAKSVLVHVNGDVLDLVLQATKAATYRVMQNAERFGSRSSGLFSNLCEDAERASAAKFLKDFNVEYVVAAQKKKEAARRA